MLSLFDFYTLHQFIADEAQRSLSLPATVYFARLDADGSLHALQLHSTDQDEVPFSELPHQVLKPHLSEDKIIIPLTLPSEEHIALVITDVDPELLKKMSPQWLQKTGEDLLSILELSCLQYKDTNLDLYNSHAAKAFIQCTKFEEPVFFLLINTVFYRRSAIGNLQKLRETADLLQVLTKSPCFTFGYGVFGVALALENREQALRQTRYLQQQLKREGLHKVQVSFAKLGSDHSKYENSLFEKIWQALTVAEQRGPFGFCDVEILQNRPDHPFKLDNPTLSARLAQRWRALSAFSLVLISRQAGTEEPFTGPAEANSIALPQHLGEYIGEDDNLTFVLIPGSDPEEVRLQVDAIRDRYQELYNNGLSLTIGVASWPCLDFTKHDVPGNCLKALLHSSYLGAGTTVFFDHISLNISGDVFFDEGDYRTAIREYRRGLRLHPNDINLMNSLGVALIECGQKRRAAECFQNVLQKDPANHMALINFGHVQQTLGRKDLALQSFELAYQGLETTSFAPQDLLIPLGKLYAECGAHKKAQAVLEQWQACPGSENEYLLYRLLGQSYFENGRHEDAKSACQKALQLFPHDSVSLSTLGLLYVESGEGDSLGLDLCQKALELDNQNPDHWYRLARALLCLMNETEALSAVKRCLQLQRYHMEGRLLLSRIYLHMKKSRLAEQAAVKVLEAATATVSQKHRAQQIITESA
ncbi:tetratricopeptide repeat protein [Desulfobulbus oligotrophicus]|uniref:Tetratricopeptide repeat protein n=1 Tax=Desulfobulbus oligotrophicus TaxID=1909699 RepID=A0A7T6ARL6_9BACT|nr:tetratricopeptide repeat protein [Desulfobulbus oligotrophicus]QQG66665.1 tetratricopeptide repeat protein [Desulfobulbus oligotrophicus]